APAQVLTDEPVTCVVDGPDHHESSCWVLAVEEHGNHPHVAKARIRFEESDQAPAETVCLPENWHLHPINALARAFLVDMIVHKARVFGRFQAPRPWRASVLRVLPAPVLTSRTFIR